MEVIKVFAQGKVHPLLRTSQAVFLKTQMSLVQGFFFALFSWTKKSAASGAVPSPSVPASVSSLTRAAYEAADEAKREARRQETFRQAAEAMDRADKRRKKKKKRRKKKLPKTGRPWLPLRRVPAFQCLLPQTQFFLRVPVISVATQMLVPTVQTVQPTLSVQMHFWYGCYAPVVVRRQVPDMVQIMQITGGSAVAVLVAVGHHSRCVPFGGGQPQDARHLCRYEPEGHVCSWLDFLVITHLALYSLRFLFGPRCSASWPVWTRRPVTW